MDEVRYQMLRPAQMVERRNACPVVYIPVGTLEWHGVHNPLGADTLQAEGLAILAAQLGGGLVFPPLYYGESRSEGLMETSAKDRDQIAAGLGVPPDNFTAARQPFTATEQVFNYQRLLMHILAEADTLGFALGVLVAGHYPLIDHCRAAVALHNQSTRVRWKGMLAGACVDYLLVRPQYPNSGDHAAGWETSHCMALHPQTVDLSLLPPVGQPLVGVGGIRPPQEATAEFGAETLRAAAEIMVKEVHHRLANRGKYTGHGSSLSEGLWKT